MATSRRALFLWGFTIGVSILLSGCARPKSKSIQSHRIKDFKNPLPAIEH